MSWSKFDDSFADHPKVRSLSDGAFRLHVNAILYASRYLTDGVIKPNMLQSMRKVHAKTRRYVVELERSGLWELYEGGGWVIHDYLEFHLSSEQVRAFRARNAERQRAFKARRRNGITNTLGNGVSNTAPNPNPLRSSGGLGVFDSSDCRAVAALSGDGSVDEPTGPTVETVERLREIRRSALAGSSS